MTMLYDPELSAYLDVDYYNQNLGGLPGGAAAEGGAADVIRSIGALISDIKQFKQQLSSWKFIEALKQIKEIINAVIAFF